MSLLDDQLSEFQAGHKLDTYMQEHNTDEAYEAHDLNQTVFDYLVNDFAKIRSEIDTLVYKETVPMNIAIGMAITKYEDFVVALYKLLETCSDEAKYAFLPKENHQYKEDICGGFRE